MQVQVAFCNGLHPVLALLIDDAHSRQNVSGQQGHQALQRSLTAVGHLGEGSESFRLQRASLLIEFSKALDNLDLDDGANLADQARQIARTWVGAEKAAPVKALLDSLQ